MKKKFFIMMILLLQILLLIGNLYAQNTRTIILNKAVDNRKLVYNEEELFKEYGVFNKDCLIGSIGYSPTRSIDFEPIISDRSIDILITEKVFDALEKCNFNVIDQSTNRKFVVLDIEIKDLFVTYSSQVYEIKIILKSPKNEVLLEKTFYHDVFFNKFYKMYFNSVNSIVEYFL